MKCRLRAEEGDVDVVAAAVVVGVHRLVKIADPVDEQLELQRTLPRGSR
jgi:hypothetical protein